MAYLQPSVWHTCSCLQKQLPVSYAGCAVKQQPWDLMYLVTSEVVGSKKWCAVCEAWWVFLADMHLKHACA